MSELVIVKKSDMVAVADAVRRNSDTTEPMTLGEIIEGIDEIGASGITPEGTIEITENGTYDVTSYASATVDVGGGESDVNPLDAFIEGSITELTSNATSVRLNAFKNCTELTTVNIPMATIIDGDAFSDCYILTTVDTSSVTSLKARSFRSCFLLKALILRSNTLCSLENTNVFTYCYHILGTGNSTYNPNGDKDGYIYVPKALIEDYKVATNWVTFASQFRALEDYTVDGTITGELDETKI